MRCLICNKFIKEFSRYKNHCSHKCYAKEWYKKNRSKAILQHKIWNEENPIARRIHLNRWLSNPNNKIKMCKNIRKWQIKHKDTESCKAKTRRLRYTKKIFVNEKCKLCKSNKLLQIHHETYPNNYQEIIDAYRIGKIYLLCRDCHFKLHHPNSDLI